MKYDREIDEDLRQAAHWNIERMLAAKKIVEDEHLNFKMFSEDDEDSEVYLSDILNEEEFNALREILYSIIDKELAKSDIVLRNACARLGQKVVYPFGFKPL